MQYCEMMLQQPKHQKLPFLEKLFRCVGELQSKGQLQL